MVLGGGGPFQNFCLGFCLCGRDQEAEPCVPSLEGSWRGACIIEHGYWFAQVNPILGVGVGLAVVLGGVP